MCTIPFMGYLALLNFPDNQNYEISVNGLETRLAEKGILFTNLTHCKVSDVW